MLFRSYTTFSPSADPAASAKMEFDVAAAKERTDYPNGINVANVDPLSQTFYVSAGAYPNGVFLTGVGLYFSSVDDNLPVFVQIRPTVNGYPSADTVVPLSTTWKNPSEITTSTDASIETIFNFGDPVFLLPGEYALVVGSNSIKNRVYYASVGSTDIKTGNPVPSQPNVGVLFKSKNASTWVAEESQDLTFKLYKAKFDTSQTWTATFESEAPSDTFYFDVVDVMTQELDFNNTTTVTYSIQNQIDGVRDTGFKPILANKNQILPASRNLTALGDTIVHADMKTLDPNVSPVIDLDRISMIGIKNIISSTRQQTTPETAPQGGNAAAKYITRRITLADGLDADNISVYFDANMQSGSSIKVYAKVLAKEDGDSFESKNWIEIDNVSPNVKYSENPVDFMEQEYTLLGLSYNSKGIKYNNFQTFAIKVVMYSDDSTIVPQIKNFRAVATS